MAWMAPTQRSGEGTKAIVKAIIDLAVNDVNDGVPKQRIMAARYFQGQLYQRHLQLLGLPPYWLPEGVEHDSLVTVTLAA